MRPSISNLADLRILVTGSKTMHSNSLLASLSALGISCIMPEFDRTKALTMFQQTQCMFDVAFFDISMHEEDHIHFIRQAAHSGRSLILLSSTPNDFTGTSEEVVRTCGAKLLGVLKIPVEFAQLKQLLSSYCGSAFAETLDMAKQPCPKWDRKELLAALRGNQFVPYFQPQVDLITGLPSCAEALVRWNHPDFGMLLPCQFIDAMEAEGLLEPLTDHLMHQALAGAANAHEWPIGISFNFSPLILENPKRSARISSLVREHGVSPEQITIEVTETTRPNDAGALLASLTRLRSEGFKISADDFGIGYSSLHEFHRTPFTEIKIDRSFVTGIAHQKKSQAIIECIVRLADKLNVRTVAEGIETNAELCFVRSVGCDLGQGFYLGEPMTQPDLYDYFHPDALREVA